MAFVTMSRSQFEEILPSDWKLIDDPRVNELIYEVPTPTKNLHVRIYSSVDKKDGLTRDVGSDAIRCVFWDTLNNRPLGRGKRINRVEGKTTIEDRLKERIDAFIAESGNVKIVDFEYVKAILSSSHLAKNGFAQSLRENLTKYKSLTAPQLAYVLGNKNPKGYDCFEKLVKIYDPNFMTNYLNSFEEDKSHEQEEEREQENGAEVQNLDEGVSDRRTGNGPDVVGNDIPLVPTREYPFWKYDFESFNVVQSAVYPYRREDKNIVISANTSSGKTICAELLIDDTLNQGKRVIYLSPLKALTQEKYDDWQKRFSKYNITILTGDYVLSEEMKTKLGKSEIIVMTSEMADSRTRKMKQEKNYWLMEVGLVICDESHILTTERGHAVESGIMRFTKINPNARIVFLSATMPNVGQLGSWLSSLNGKETEVVYSTWRPVALNLNFCEYPLIHNSYGRMDYHETQKVKRSMAIEIAMSKPDEKFLIFVFDKNTGRQLISEFARAGEEVKFHNADEDRETRLELETAFRKRDGGLRVMISTTTCAWGLNLPARNVICVGVHRGIQEVDELDLIQASGRAGRYGIDDKGDVYLIIPEMSTSRWKEVFRNPRPVLSVLNDHDTLAFHVVSEIESRSIKTARDMVLWFQRSLAFFQDSNFMLDDAEMLMEDLEKMKMITIDEIGNASVTGLGRVSSWMYFSPYDVYARYLNFQKILSDTSPDDLSIAWAIANVPTNNLGYIPKDVQYDCEDLQRELGHMGLRTGTNLHMILAAHKCITGDEGSGALGAYMRAIRFDIRRIVQSVDLTDGLYAKWERKDLWAGLPDRITYGIPEYLLGLVKLKGIGAKRAKILWEAGIKTVEDIVNNDNKKSLFKLFKPKLAQQIRETAISSRNNS